MGQDFGDAHDGLTLVNPLRPMKVRTASCDARTPKVLSASRMKGIKTDKTHSVGLDSGSAATMLVFTRRIAGSIA
jgi:hypothetical protein